MRRSLVSGVSPLTLAWLMCGGLMLPSAQAQVKDQLALPNLQLLKAGLAAQTKPLELNEGVPMDAPLDPVEYTVGPGDRIAVNVWSSAPVEHTLTVAPEGVLIIPNVGTVDVRDLSLARVKEKVATLLGRKYLSAEISVSLLAPRKVSVTILGNVLNEGKKDVNAAQRVDNLIALSNDFPTGRMDAGEYAGQLSQLRAGRSDRKIIIQRRNGELRTADLVRYRATGIGKYNPYLREGDVIYVPRRWDKDNVIGMFGGVMETANFEFVPGDSLSTLVAMSMGFRPEADPTRALLTRLSPDGSSMDSVHLDAKAIVERRAPDVALRPGDRLMVPFLPVLAANFRVTVEGEVLMPGMYPITRNATRLSEVIRLAGGLTSEANLSGATLSRTRISETDPARDMERERLFSLRSSLPVQDTSYYRVETSLRIMGEVVALDLPGLLLRGDSTRDVMLQPRDRIIIPAKQRTVYVFGQVLAPGHVMFGEGQPYRYYVDRAGGYTNDARSGDVKVIKGGTRAWLDPGETKVEDGDMIWVPKEPSYPFSYYLTTWAQVAGIIGTVATVALLIKTVK